MRWNQTSQRFVPSSLTSAALQYPNFSGGFVDLSPYSRCGRGGPWWPDAVCGRRAVMFSLVHKKTTRGWFLIWNGRSEDLKLHRAPAFSQADWRRYCRREPFGGLLKPPVPLRSDNVEIRVAEINFSRQLRKLLGIRATCAVGIVIQSAGIRVVYYPIRSVVRCSTNMKG
jgi:hypothetical protein